MLFQLISIHPHRRALIMSGGTSSNILSRFYLIGLEGSDGSSNDVQGYFSDD